jgi:anti-sigma regulatory factor (Ser/Thr protein kinase)
MERLTIRIPPAAAHVASVRAFVGAIGRRFGCSEEAIDDLRLASTEACAQAIEEDAADRQIEVRTLVEDHRLLLEIEPSGSFDRAPEGLAEGPGRSTRRALIEGLFPDAEFDREREVLRIAVPLTTG